MKHTIPASELAPARTLVNHNRLLRENGDVIGVKTGFTKKCGRTLVSAARRDGVTLVAVTLCAPDDWRDHRAMLDEGFELYENELICGEGSLSFELAVTGGEVASVTCKNEGELFARLPKGHGEVTFIAELPRFIYAGQKKGERVGRVRFFESGRELGELPLYLAEDAPKKIRKK